MIPVAFLPVPSLWVIPFDNIQGPLLEIKTNAGVVSDIREPFESNLDIFGLCLSVQSHLPSSFLLNKVTNFHYYQVQSPIAATERKFKSKVIEKFDNGAHATKVS